VRHRFTYSVKSTQYFFHLHSFGTKTVYSKLQTIQRFAPKSTSLFEFLALEPSLPGIGMVVWTQSLTFQKRHARIGGNEWKYDNTLHKGKDLKMVKGC
jgi:hypothetical protein